MRLQSPTFNLGDIFGCQNKGFVIELFSYWAMTEVQEISTSLSNSTQDVAEDILKEKESIRLDPRTIFVDQIDFNVKHPLERSWTLWYDSPQKKTNHSNWMDNLKSVYTFSTVEDFWGMFNNISKVSEIPVGSNFHLFKEGTKPMWEDAENEKGGKWVVSFTKSKSDARGYGDMDQKWLSLVLAVIGEAFQFGEDVCGIVVSMRKAQNRIAIWTKDSTNKQSCETIGRQLKTFLELPADLRLSYQAHADAYKGSLVNKDLFTV